MDYIQMAVFEDHVSGKLTLLEVAKSLMAAKGCDAQMDTRSLPLQQLLLSKTSRSDPGIHVVEVQCHPGPAEYIEKDDEQESSSGDCPESLAGSDSVSDEVQSSISTVSYPISDSVRSRTSSMTVPPSPGTKAVESLKSLHQQAARVDELLTQGLTPDYKVTAEEPNPGFESSKAKTVKENDTPLSPHDTTSQEDGGKLGKSHEEESLPYDETVFPECNLVPLNQEELPFSCSSSPPGPTQRAHSAPNLTTYHTLRVKDIAYEDSWHHWSGFLRLRSSLRSSCRKLVSSLKRRRKHKYGSVRKKGNWFLFVFIWLQT